MPTILDFEQPIYDLEKKASKRRSFSEDDGVDVSHGLELLQARIAEEKTRVFAELTAWQRVQLARHPDRPYPKDYIGHLFTDFLELHGDRRYSDDQAIIGGFAKFDGDPVMVIGSQKGRDLEQSVKVNFGSAHPEGYRKALRLMELANKAKTPIISFIDTPGAYPGIAAEERHIGEAIAVNLREMFRFTVPILVVVVGEGGSGGALGIGVGNRILIMQNSYYSVITPEGCAAILWRDGAAAPKAAEALRLTPSDLMEFGIADGIIPEPLGGAHRDHEGAAKLLGEALKKNLDELRKLPPQELQDQRYAKYRALGVFDGE